MRIRFLFRVVLFFLAFAGMKETVRAQEKIERVWYNQEKTAKIQIIEQGIISSTVRLCG